MDRVAKAISAGAGAALTAYTAAQVAGHLSWLSLTGCLVSGGLAGLIVWAVPNTPTVPPKP